MSTRLLFIGLDAAEAELLERFAADGACPTLAGLIERGATIALSNSLETLPGAIWPEISTGIGCGRVPHFYHGQQLHTGEAVKRPIAPEDIDAGLYYWVRASRAGARVFVADIPQTIAAPDFNGLQLFEYGTHDRNFAITSEPPSLLQEIRARHGDHPIVGCDQHGETRAGYTRLLDGLKRGAAMKAEIFRDYLGREDWDLFNVCFTEGHCCGHQFWHFADPDHPRHDPDAPAEFRSAIRDVYGRLDAGVGELIAAAGPEATVMVLASHGMGLYAGGPNLLNEVLARLGLTSEGADKASGRFWRTLQFSSSPALRRLRESLRPLIGRRVIRSIQSGSG